MLRSLLRSGLRKLGYDIHRFGPGQDPFYDLARFLGRNRVDIGALGEQHFDGFQVAIGGRPHERRAAGFILVVDWDIFLHQQAHGGKVVRLRGRDEGSALGFRAMLQQEAHSGGRAIIGGRQV